MRYANTLLGMCCALALSTGTALAADANTTKPDTKMGVSPSTSSTMNADRKVNQAEDGEWIRLSGTVSAVSDDEFTLDYGKDKITVETDDFPSGALRALKTGDRVIVSGRIDDGFFTSKEIVASTVRIHSSNKTLSANRTAMDDSHAAFPGGDTALNAEDGDHVAVTGKVLKTDGDDFTSQTGSQKISVDAGDAKNFDTKRLKVGDRVSVIGEMDDGLFSGREIEASSVMILSNTAPSTGKGAS